MVNDKDLLAKLATRQLFEALVLHRPVHIVIELCNNGQRNEVKNDVDRVISRTNHADVGQLDRHARQVLQKPGEPRDTRVLELVGVIHRVLHHLEARVHLIHTRQMQDRRTNEASKDNEHCHLANNDLVVVAISHQLVEREHN